jgi:hypothetical protein
MKGDDESRFVPRQDLTLITDTAVGLSYVNWFTHSDYVLKWIDDGHDSWSIQIECNKP